MKMRNRRVRLQSDGPLRLAQRSSVVAPSQIDERQEGVDRWRNGIGAPRQLDLRGAFLIAPKNDEQLRIPLVRGGVTGPEAERVLVTPLRLGPIPLVILQHVGQRRMRVREVRVQLE